MTLDPASAQNWANVYGGGLAGAIIVTLLAGIVGQFVFFRKDRLTWDEERTKTAEKHAQALEKYRSESEGRTERSIAVAERTFAMLEVQGKALDAIAEALLRLSPRRTRAREGP